MNRQEVFEEAIAALLPGSVVTAYALVVDAVREDGVHELHRLRGPETITTWAARGLLHAALDETDWEDNE